MKKCVFILLCIGSLFSKEYAAVMDFEGIGVTKDEARALTQKLTSELISIGQFKLIERSEMTTILEEQKFQNSGCTDDKCATQIGQLLNADYIVIGTVSKVGTYFSVDARLISVGTGELYGSGSYYIEGNIGKLLVGGMRDIALQLSSKDDYDKEENKKNKPIINAEPVFEIQNKVETKDLTNKIEETEDLTVLALNLIGASGYIANGWNYGWQTNKPSIYLGPFLLSSGTRLNGIFKSNYSLGLIWPVEGETYYDEDTQDPKSTFWYITREVFGADTSYNSDQDFFSSLFASANLDGQVFEMWEIGYRFLVQNAGTSRGENIPTNLELTFSYRYSKDATNFLNKKNGYSNDQLSSLSVLNGFYMSIGISFGWVWLY